MDISKLCTTAPVEEVKVLPSPQSTDTINSHNLTPIAALTDRRRIITSSIPDPCNSLSSDVRLPKIRYPHNNNNDNNEPHTFVNNLSIHDTNQHTSTRTYSETTDFSINNSNKNNIGSKRKYSDNDNSGPQQQSSTLLSNHCIQNNINITDIISQCSRLCDNLDRCKKQSQNENDRQDLLQNAAQTARDILSSLGALQKQQKKHRHYIMDENISSTATSINTEEAESSETIILRRSRTDSDNSTRPKIKRRTKRSTAGQRCHSCHTTETPEWRRGPDGARTLCNACGLHYAKLLRKGSLTVQTQGFLIDNGGVNGVNNALTNNNPNANNDININININNNNNNNGTTQQQLRKRQPRIIQYPIIQVHAKPDTSSTSSSNRVKFINSEISYPRDDKWRICGNRTIPDTSTRIVEIEED
ncbi:hypothetical protein INT45_013195 [Circinella minor]|uniref:GATA-type domain-containing protein n=1 Tax=Circinella minor TaxID=1195481 RepID=A0A8H7RWN0_9FUNG|nr:hypothetical protein INT45_013195 [Circinella minor]